MITLNVQYFQQQLTSKISVCCLVVGKTSVVEKCVDIDQWKNAFFKFYAVFDQNCIGTKGSLFHFWNHCKIVSNQESFKVKYNFIESDLKEGKTHIYLNIFGPFWHWFGFERDCKVLIHAFQNTYYWSNQGLLTKGLTMPGFEYLRK